MWETSNHDIHHWWSRGGLGALGYMWNANRFRHHLELMWANFKITTYIIGSHHRGLGALDLMWNTNNFDLRIHISVVEIIWISREKLPITTYVIWIAYVRYGGSVRAYIRKPGPWPVLNSLKNRGSRCWRPRWFIFFQKHKSPVIKKYICNIDFKINFNGFFETHI